MLKKIGLSTAALFAAMALVQAPSALAADRDDFRTHNNYAPSYGSGYRDDTRHNDYRDADRDDYRYVPQSRDFRFRGRFEYNAPHWRVQQSRWSGDRDHDGDRR
jgi:hypothetical protein